MLENQWKWSLSKLPSRIFLCKVVNKQVRFIMEWLQTSCFHNINNSIIEKNSRGVWVVPELFLTYEPGSRGEVKGNDITTAVSGTSRVGRVVSSIVFTVCTVLAVLCLLPCPLLHPLLWSPRPLPQTLPQPRPWPLPWPLTEWTLSSSSSDDCYGDKDWEGEYDTLSLKSLAADGFHHIQGI